MFQFKFTAEGKGNGAPTAFYQSSLVAQLIAQGLRVDYCIVSTQADITEYSVSLAVQSTLASGVVTGKVRTALVSLFDFIRNLNLYSQTFLGTSATEDSLPIPSTAYPNTSGTYTVVNGDTLSKIGAKLGVNWQTIAALNGITSPYTIRIGQVLRTNSNTSAPTNAPTIIQPYQVPSVLSNSSQSNNTNIQQPSPPKSKWLDDLSKTFGVAPYVVGLAGLAVVLVYFRPRK